MTLRYVGIRVTDLDRSVAFYVQGLGLVERGRGSMSHGGQFVGLEDPTSQQALELNWYPPGHAYATPFVVGEGLDHIGVEVDDPRAVIDRLVGLGGEIAIAPWVEHGRLGPYLIGFVTDPDGHWIEVQGSVPAAPPYSPRRSTIRLSPFPPPMHRVASPSDPFERTSSWTSVTTIRAPLIPIGWPSAIAPPCTLN